MAMAVELLISITAFIIQIKNNYPSIEKEVFSFKVKSDPMRTEVGNISLKAKLF
jgi:hypothetical protein